MSTEAGQNLFWVKSLNSSRCRQLALLQQGELFSVRQINETPCVSFRRAYRALLTRIPHLSYDHTSARDRYYQLACPLLGEVRQDGKVSLDLSLSWPSAQSLSLTFALLDDEQQCPCSAVCLISTCLRLLLVKGEALVFTEVHYSFQFGSFSHFKTKRMNKKGRF